MKVYYIPYSDESKVLWLNNFAAKLPEVKDRYTLTDQELNDATAAAFYFESIVKIKNQFAAYTKALTAFKNALRDGIGKSMPQAALPEIPTYGGLPSTAPTFDIFGRMASIAQHIKTHYHYNESDGKNLGLIGTDIMRPDNYTIQPQLTVVVAAGGHHEIVWKKNGMTALEIMVSRDGGLNWAWLAIDTIPNYTDECPLPQQPTVWQYKAIYRMGDAPAGQWSDVVSVTVLQR